MNLSVKNPKLTEDLIFARSLNKYTTHTLQLAQKELEYSIMIRNRAFQIIQKKYKEYINSDKPERRVLIGKIQLIIHNMMYQGSMEDYQIKYLHQEIKLRNQKNL